MALISPRQKTKADSDRSAVFRRSRSWSTARCGAAPGWRARGDRKAYCEIPSIVQLSIARLQYKLLRNGFNAWYWCIYLSLLPLSFRIHSNKNQCHIRIQIQVLHDFFISRMLKSIDLSAFPCEVFVMSIFSTPSPGIRNALAELRVPPRRSSSNPAR